MDNNFWKPFLALFSIGAILGLARSLKLKSKKTAGELIAECIISGGAATGAGLLYVFYPTVPFVAVMGLGAIIAVLGVNFFSHKIENAIDSKFPRVKDK